MHQFPYFILEPVNLSKMRILFLADIKSDHTQKWVRGLSALGIQIGIFSFNKADIEWYKDLSSVEVVYQPADATVTHSYSNKLRYLHCFRIIKRKIKTFKPDIVHAHYASSYGYLGAFSGFHPFIVSAWGSDVMKFPYESKLKKAILSYSLKKADVICATSFTLEDYIHRVVKKEVQVIPFGIDMNWFVPDLNARNSSKFVFGVVKSLEKIYNQDILIEAFALLVKKHPSVELILVGDGSQMNYLKNLCKQLNLENNVIFTGRIPWRETRMYFNKLNCLVNISQYESFGVSVLEAMACKVAVIVSETGGLKEIVKNHETGLYVTNPNAQNTMEVMEKVMIDNVLREKLIASAYLHVETHYNWEKNLQDQVKLYQRFCSK